MSKIRLVIEVVPNIDPQKSPTVNYQAEGLGNLGVLSLMNDTERLVLSQIQQQIEQQKANQIAQQIQRSGLRLHPN